MTWYAIFDFDGVIVQSEKQHQDAWFQVAKKRGLPITREAFLTGFGVKNQYFIAEILGWTKDPEEIAHIIAEKEAIFQKMAESGQVTLIPGVEKWLKELAKAHIPCAVGSSSIRKNIDLVLAHTTIQGYFSVIVSGEMVTHGKPDPEVFLKCAEALKMVPAQCTVYEDAPAGIMAAKRAGMKAVALTTTFERAVFEKMGKERPDRIITDFTEERLNAKA